MSKADEMSYEEFLNVKKELIENIDNKMSKQTFEEVIKNKKQIKQYEDKIDKLALEFYVDLPNKEILGYYAILEHCVRKIKENDKNLFVGFANPMGIKKE